MREPVHIIGTYLSPYVRKVLVVLHLKGIAYDIDPIIPFMGDDRFSRLSPLRRIPVLLDGELTLADSSVICQYLEDRHPEPALYPRDVVQRARARWLEEFADTRMGEVFIWRLFNQLVIRRFVWKEQTDGALVARTLAEDVPAILDYLESEVPSAGYLFGDLSIADVSIACFFRNAAMARLTIDAARWPRSAAFVERVVVGEGFQRLKPFEERLMRTPIPEHRAVLASMQAPVARETYATPLPRRGVMQI